MRWLAADEAERQLTSCRKSRNQDLADLVEFVMFTGLRQAEALELTWDRVERARGIILLEDTKSDKRREARGPFSEGPPSRMSRISSATRPWQ